MTRLEPAAYLAIDGVDVARSTVAGVPTDLLAMDGLSATWGREEVLDQPEPATATVTLFDPSRRWHRSRNWVGALVTLRWELVVAGVPTSRIFFRGRVGRINPVITTLAGVRGTLVTLDLTSVVADLGNVITTADWPSETWAAPYAGMPAGGPRRTRIINELAAAGFPGNTLAMTVGTLWDNVTAIHVLPEDQLSLLDHVRLVYDSFVDRMNYSPHGNTFTAVGSRDYTNARSLGRLVSDAVGAGTPRAGQGVYVTARARNGGPGLYLNAREVEYPDDAGIALDQTSALTRIRLTTTDYISSQDVKKVAERVVTGAKEGLYGIRALNVDSALGSAVETGQLNRWETLARQDATTWQLEPVAFRTGPAGGFEDFAQVLALLSGEESNALVFLEGSELPLYGVCPVVGVMGGTITQRAGHWEVEAVLVSAALVAAQHPLTFEELDAGTAGTQIQVWDSPHPLGFHSSLTFEDLAWVGVGHGLPDLTSGPDQGWDYFT